MRLCGRGHWVSAILAKAPVFALLLLFGPSATAVANAQEGDLQRLREDVRGVPQSVPTSPPPEQAKPSQVRSREVDPESPWDDLSPLDGLTWQGILLGASAPLWMPCALLDDGWDAPAYFPAYPYDHVPGHLVIDKGELAKAVARTPDETWLGLWPTTPRRWGARLDVEYADDFDSLNRLGAHLLISNSWRWELDAQADYFEESLRNAGHDRLWLGDGNITFRFAQSQRAQVRAGFGLNWLSDERETEFGFNFTYGVDVFPRKPWVLTSSIDWGTLGSAELFRFRLTAGIMVRGVEAYTGYEYLDIDRTQGNALVAGVRVWF